MDPWYGSKKELLKEPITNNLSEGKITVVEEEANMAAQKSGEILQTERKMLEIQINSVGQKTLGAIQIVQSK